ncbi:MAG TPA: hypothetical protein VIZ65_02540 [Cellvibrionaceae bacterium]
MAAIKFTPHPDFPKAKCFFTPAGYFWKIQLREWAFAQINVEHFIAGLKATSNNPNVAQGNTGVGPKALTLSNIKGTGATVKLFADKPGFTLIYFYDQDPAKLVDGVHMQVEVLTRRANKPTDISLTKLEGRTVAINAPDARAYEMQTTLKFSDAASNPLGLFTGVPTGTQHLVISSHGGVPSTTDRNDVGKICLFVAGFKLNTLRLDTGNVEEVFKTLKGRLAANCVIWFGGCNIGANRNFCSKAAIASGCYVVAPVMPLLNKTFPKNFVDMLDGFAIPAVFDPTGKGISVSDFCAKQADLKFNVPV